MRGCRENWKDPELGRRMITEAETCTALDAVIQPSFGPSLIRWIRQAQSEWGTP
jgi:hypothetical protein